MAADGYLGDICDALVTVLSVATDDFDFTASGAVLCGTYEIRPQPHFISISPPDLRSSQGPTLKHYERALSLLIVATAPSNAHDVHEHSLISRALMVQVIQALEEGRQSNAVLASLREFVVASGTLDPAVDGCPVELAVAYLTLECAYKHPSRQAGP
jgi:hypothetical protein